MHVEDRAGRRPEPCGLQVLGLGTFDLFGPLRGFRAFRCFGPLHGFGAFRCFGPLRGFGAFDVLGPLHRLGMFHGVDLLRPFRLLGVVLWWRRNFGLVSVFAMGMLGRMVMIPVGLMAGGGGRCGRLGPLVFELDALGRN